MTSFQISLTRSRREATRFVNRVRRQLQKALAEEHAKSGLTQSEIARLIGVHRSVINREIQGYQDLTLGRVAELACAMGRRAKLELPEIAPKHGANIEQEALVNVSSTNSAVEHNEVIIQQRAA